MQLLYDIIGIDSSIVLDDKVDKPEQTSFKFIGVLLIFSVIFSFFGCAQLVYFISENWVFSFLASCFWALLCLNLYRLLLLISFSEEEDYSFFTFSNLLNTLFLFFFSLVGAVGFVCFVCCYFDLCSQQTDEINGVINGINMVNYFLASSGNYLNVILFGVTVLLMMLPYIVLIFSSKIKNGNYLVLLKQQKTDMIKGNYLMFKSDYRKTLVNSINHDAVNYSRLENGNFFSDDNILSPYEFYEAFEDAPFNTIRKEEW